MKRKAPEAGAGDSSDEDGELQPVTARARVSAPTGTGSGDGRKTTRWGGVAASTPAAPTARSGSVAAGLTGSGAGAGAGAGAAAADGGATAFAEEDERGELWAVRDATEKRRRLRAQGGRKEDPRSRRCPYLDTINRPRLDFDFEKVCSITLSNQNVYGCLICGRFFQGRGHRTQAYTHSVQASHHVFISLDSAKVYCLPDNYEVLDSSLDDIKFALSPTFQPAEIASLETNRTLSTDISGVKYLRGFVGLNNLKCTDFINVVVQALCHVVPLRDFFLRRENYAACTSALVHKFGELMRKLWSARNFKSTVDPHEFVQQVTVASGKRFQIGTQSECMDFLSWLLNTLHHDLMKAYAKVDGVRRKPPGASGSSNPKSSIICDCFQGEVQVTTERWASEDDDAKKEDSDSDSDEDLDDEAAAAKARAKRAKRTAKLKQMQEEAEKRGTGPTSVSTARVKFLLLSLELPPVPLFKDSMGTNLIPQVPLFTVLNKFNGEHATEFLLGEERQRKRYRVLKLPAFLIFHLKRFTRNNWFVEKNPTIVTFPVKNLELKDYVSERALRTLPTADQVAALSAKQLLALAKKHPIKGPRPVEKSELVRAVQEAVARTAAKRGLLTKYHLMANIVHDTPVEEASKSVKPRKRGSDPMAGGSYRVHVVNPATEQWYEIQDLHVQETMPQLIGLSESYVMIYRRAPAVISGATEPAVKADGDGDVAMA